jgi:PKD repeat protein
MLHPCDGSALRRFFRHIALLAAVLLTLAACTEPILPEPIPIPKEPLEEFDPFELLGGKLYTGTQRALFMQESSALVTNWSWDFGGGAEPDQLEDEDGAVTFGAPGSYRASVTVSNPSGSRAVPFTLVVAPLDPPDIEVRPQMVWFSGNIELAQAGNSGGPIDTWLWEFNGAAVEATADRMDNAVEAGATGVYHARVTASNSAGSDSIEFTIVVKTRH